MVLLNSKHMDVAALFQIDKPTGFESERFLLSFGVAYTLLLSHGMNLVTHLHPEFAPQTH